MKLRKGKKKREHGESRKLLSNERKGPSIVTAGPVRLEPLLLQQIQSHPAPPLPGVGQLEEVNVATSGWRGWPPAIRAPQSPRIGFSPSTRPPLLLAGFIVHAIKPSSFLSKAAIFLADVG